MFKMKLLYYVLIGFFCQQSYAQDVWLQNFFAPNSGCELTNSELVNVLINNNSGSFIPANSITVRYSVDAGAPVSELLGVNLGSGASWNFTFGVPSNLMACGAHDLKVWVSYASDPNPMNDTLNWVVQNDCTIVPGVVTSDSSVCEGMNGATLDLVGWMNGTIVDWQESTDSGVTWTGLGNSTTSNVYTNIDTTTLYQVIIDGGFCPDDTSNFATITVQPFPVGGVISSSATHCVDDVNGTLTLSGASGAVIFWQYSENNGSSWTTLANSTTTQNYLNLTTDTWYRTSTDGAICPNVFSDTAVISIDQLTVPGTLGADDLICEGSPISLTLTGNTGSVTDWESSEDLIIWSALGETTVNYNSPPLIETTYYRTFVQNGICPGYYSDTVMIGVQDMVIGGNIDGSVTLCASLASDTLILSNNTGTISSWELSIDDGASWGLAPSSNDTLIFNGLASTTWYRVLIDGGVCPDMYSDTAVVTIWEDSYAGILVNDAVICEGESVFLQIAGNTGSTIFWESSVDAVIWNLIDVDTINQTVLPTTSTSYRVIVQNESCPLDTSNLIDVTVNPLPVVDAGLNMNITEFDTIQLNGSPGTNVLWSPSFNVSDSSISNPFAWPTTTTTYTYVVTSAEGCEASDMVTVTVAPFIEPTINIRNVVTANGDGYNDVWLITGIEDFPETEVHIFNIYGQEVYQNVDYQNDWGGSFNGNPLPNGTYHYIVRLKGEEEVIKGNLTLLGNE